MKLFLVTICAFFGLIHGQLTELPKCSWDDPNLKTCLVDLFEVIRPLLKIGIPGIIPRLEPFTLEKLPLEASLPAMKLHVEATNVVASGGSNMQITSFKIDVNKKTADITVVIPKLQVTADYTSEAQKLYFINVHSGGIFTGTFYDVTVQIKAHGRVNNDYNPTHLVISDMEVDVSFGEATTFHLENTEGGIAAKTGTNMINIASKALVLYILKSTINKTTGEILQKYLNMLLNKLPFQSLLQ